MSPQQQPATIKAERFEHGKGQVVLYATCPSCGHQVAAAPPKDGPALAHCRCGLSVHLTA